MEAYTQEEVGQTREEKRGVRRASERHAKGKQKAGKWKARGERETGEERHEIVERQANGDLEASDLRNKRGAENKTMRKKR